MLSISFHSRLPKSLLCAIVVVLAVFFSVSASAQHYIHPRGYEYRVENVVEVVSCFVVKDRVAGDDFGDEDLVCGGVWVFCVGDAVEIPMWYVVDGVVYGLRYGLGGGEAIVVNGEYQIDWNYYYFKVGPVVRPMPLLLPLRLPIHRLIGA